MPSVHLPNGCGACLHDKREALDEYLANGYLTQVAEVMFGLDAQTLIKHRDEHLKGMALRVQSDPIRIVRIVQDMVEMARAAAMEAHANEDKKLMLAAIRQTLECVRLEAELTNAGKRFDPKALLPLWQKMQQRLVTALEPFPEARDAVLGALQDLDVDEAQEPRRKKRLM